MGKMKLGESKSVTAKHNHIKKLPPEGPGPEGTRGAAPKAPEFERVVKSVPKVVKSEAGS